MPGQAKPTAADDPCDFVVIPSDQVRVAPSDAEISDLLRAAARHQSESGGRATSNPSGRSAVPAVDTRFRATAVNDDVPSPGRTFGRRVMRAATALLLAIGIGAAALTWQTFGYAAKKAVFKWAPSWAVTASLPWNKLGFTTESAASDEAADAPPAQAAAPAQSAAENNAPADAAVNAVATPPDAAQQLQSMARDLANANQEVETLKASLAELKASQQQMAHDLAKVTEQNAKAKIAAVPPRPPVPARKPAPVYSPTSAAPLPGYRPSPAYSAQASVPPAAPAQSYVPPPVQLQTQADPGLPATAPRPPMPVRAPMPEQ